MMRVILVALLSLHSCWCQETISSKDVEAKMAEKDYHDKSCPNKRVDLKQALEVIKNNTCMHMGVGGLWPKHAAELAKALETNTAMQMLDLNEYNEVGDEGAEAFGKMFRVNKHLKAIFMANNAITEVGVNHRTVSPATEPQSARLNRDQPDHHEPTRPVAKIVTHRPPFTSRTAPSSWPPASTSSTATTPRWSPWTWLRTRSAPPARRHLPRHSSTTGGCVPCTLAPTASATRFISPTDPLTTVLYIILVCWYQGLRAVRTYLELCLSLPIFQPAGLCDQGAKAFASTLKSNKVLQTLYMRRNRITDVGFKPLLAAMEKNEALIKVGSRSADVGACRRPIITLF
jgi:hypothetical protein